MKVTRRHFTMTAGAALGAALLPRRGWAGASVEMGSARIDVLSDGHLILPGGFILGDLPADEVAPILARYGLDGNEFRPDCNVTLYRDGTNTVLFDVGSGNDFMPSAGKLPEALDALGVSAEEVTHVVFTHGHPDHLWGLLDEFDEPLFANASFMIGRTERDYWTDPNTVSTIDPARQTFAVGAKRRLDAIADLVEVFEDGAEILPGIAARATIGHTPGHMAFEIRQGNEAAMVLGDCIGNHHLAFERPDWLSGSDQDKPLAAETRVGLLDQLAAEQTRLIGFHLPFPGIGRAERFESGYRYVPED
ncbi:MBL fold metallo-hydrolase [Ostreiculturibacter nitratireducens]|uniref:MBL fold metallo-hydrolase n=1 Tax=Ostreiculturibacter nitratireducens TaxID=3075226 RepID=UPI0031B5B4B1